MFLKFYIPHGLFNIMLNYDLHMVQLTHLSIQFDNFY